MISAIEAATRSIDILFKAADRGDIVMVKEVLDTGADIDAIDDATGLSALHFAIGRNHFELTKLLLDRGATFRPDRRGRWPSTIAELCEVDEELLDLVVEAEAKFDAV